MTHHTTQHLESSLARLNNLRRTVAPDAAPMVCRVCYTIQGDYDGGACFCASSSYTLLGVVIADIVLELLRRETKCRACRTARVG